MDAIFETHAHFDDDAFDADREELISSLPSYGVMRAVTAGSSMATSEAAAALAASHENIYAAVGVHPSDTEGLTEADMERLAALYAQDKVAAIGEIGLDYHWPEPDRETQLTWFSRQLALAKELDAPVVIHSRDAARDTLDMVRTEGAGLVMDIHCFSYGVEMAREFLSLGHYLGIGGVLTFKNGRKLREVAAYAPLDRILLETDCPYLAPEPFRGRRNSSFYLPYVVREIARIKGLYPEEAEAITWENARRFYRIPDGGKETL